MPDLQVLPLLVSLVFDAMEEGEKNKIKTKQEKKRSTTLVIDIFIVCAI